MDGGTFREWLAGRVGDDAGLVSIRELARRLADADPTGSMESHRRSVRRILKGERNPRQPYRDAIQAALGDRSAPSEDEEARDSAVTRELVLQKIDEHASDLMRLKRAIVEKGLI